MPAEENLTTKLEKAQSIDFVEQFGLSIKKLLDMLKIERKIVMPIGSSIQTYTSKVTLAGGAVGEGDIIPLSKVQMDPGKTIPLVWDKRRKAVSVEAIQKYGFQRAISDTDAKLIRELQSNIKKNFFKQLKDEGNTKVQGVGLQGAMAKAWGAVAGKFEEDDVITIAFVNPADVADYLATASITVQNAFGLKYIENFLGVDVAVISTGVTAKHIYATAADNLVLAYATVGSGEIGKAFDFTTDETGIIGISHTIEKSRLTAETVTLSATVLFAERTDGIVESTITDAGLGA